MSDARVTGQGSAGGRYVYVHDQGDFARTDQNTEVWVKDPRTGHSWKLQRAGNEDRGFQNPGTGVDEKFLAYGHLPGGNREADGLQVFVNRGGGFEAQERYTVAPRRNSVGIRLNPGV